MKIFMWNILLGLTWATMTGRFTPINVTIGFAVSYFILWFTQPVIGRSNYFLKVYQVISLVLFFLWELILANLRVAHDVLTPAHHSKPGVIAIPLDAETDTEITVLANLITLTPGTLSLDVSDDRKVLYIHAMFVEDPEALRQEIKDGFERRVLEVLR